MPSSTRQLQHTLCTVLAFVTLAQICYLNINSYNNGWNRGATNFEGDSLKGTFATPCTLVTLRHMYSPHIPLKPYYYNVTFAFLMTQGSICEPIFTQILPLVWDVNAIQLRVPVQLYEIPIIRSY